LLGTVEKTNRLITVNPLRCCYSPQIGDIVVGRVNKIRNRCWRIDINSSSHALLNLNATYFPEHRKKNEDDELNMRNILAEEDLVVAEVHSLNNDRTVNLHTRNSKYGRLEPGVLIEVDHKSVKRQKHHMVQLGPVSLILSNNGFLWLSNIKRNESLEVFNERKVQEDYTVEQIAAISMLHNILKVLDWQGLEISEDVLTELISYCKDRKIETTDILHELLITQRDSPMSE
jgi:exosome complex component RRP4